MVPLIVVGVAAFAAFFASGCNESPAQPDKSPDPDPPSTPPRPVKETLPPTDRPETSPPDPAPGQTPQTPVPQEGKKMSEEELRKTAECLRVQFKYKFDCPPPEALPPYCKCEVIRRIDRFDPATPLRVREQLVPANPVVDPGLPNS
jgi:hypothetical protein